MALMAYTLERSSWILLAPVGRAAAPAALDVSAAGDITGWNAVASASHDDTCAPTVALSLSTMSKTLPAERRTGVIPRRAHRPKNPETRQSFAPGTHHPIPTHCHPTFSLREIC
eukprot:1135607-Rhodomonas_salina.2